MDNSRLPVEMCEHIIDSVTHDAWYDSTECDIWCLTALVCAVWLPRSRFNLYHTVRLWRAGQVDLLCRTLEENSLFAHLIVALKVDLDSAEYIPFTRLAPLLKECVILRLDGMGGWKFYPTRFADTCLNQFSLLGIVKLRLTVAKSTARGLLRFIRSLTTLEQLTLDGEESLPEMRPIPALGARRSQNGKLAGLSKLKKLKLKNGSVSIKFPPHYFGDAVGDLSLQMNGCEISPELLQCIQNFHRLQTLNINFWLDDNTDNPQSASKMSQRLFSILTSVSSGSALQVLKVSLFPTHSPHPTPEKSYLVDRSGLLDLLAGEDMLNVLDRLPSLSQLGFALLESDKHYDGVWGKEEMVRRLPSRLHGAVTFEVYMHRNCLAKNGPFTTENTVIDDNFDKFPAPVALHLYDWTIFGQFIPLGRKVMKTPEGRSVPMWSNGVLITWT